MTTINTIPAKDLVAVNPSVLAAGGTGLDLVGLFLTTNTRVPVGTVLSFASSAAVGAFFGLSSNEYLKSLVYFAGFDNSNIKPEAMLFVQCPQAPVGAYVRGGNISKVPLATLQGYTGTLTVVIDGYTWAAGSVSLSAATSFSSAASILQTALQTSPLAEGSATGSIAAATATGTGSISGNQLTMTAVTGTLVAGTHFTGTGVASNTKIVQQLSGTLGGIGVYAVNNSQTVVSTALSFTYGIFTAASALTGAFAVGQTLSGSGVTANTLITQLDSGTGGLGTYYVDLTQTAGSTTITGSGTLPTITYDSQSGAFVISSGIAGAASTVAFPTGSIVTSLLLTSVTGATLNQGAVWQTPAAFMGSVVALSQNWATFTTFFDPDQGAGNSEKLAYAAWTSSTNGRYAFSCWDHDVSPTVSNPATGSLGYLIAQANYSGTILNWEPSDEAIATFVCGMWASVDFDETGGRITAAFKGQTGLTPGVTNETVANNLIANGYNFYGSYATADQQFTLYQRGTISGPFDFADTYMNQIWLNNAFQLDLLLLLQQSRSVPYNPTGYGLIEASLNDTIQQALRVGVIQPGVTLSSAQIAAVNASAGTKIDGILSTRGWYLQILDAPPSVRQVRGTPPCTFWYTDGESIQQITLASVVLQ